MERSKPTATQSNRKSRHEKNSSEVHIPIPLECEANNKFIDSPRSIQKKQEVLQLE